MKKNQKSRIYKQAMSILILAFCLCIFVGSNCNTTNEEAKPEIVQLKQPSEASTELNSQSPIKSEDIRRTAVAGQFYPGDKSKLQEMVNYYLENSKVAKDIHGKIWGLISPHAGYPYSGYTAANAYRRVRGKDYDVVFIIAPSHYDPFPGATVWEKGAYETPLGLVPVHQKLAQALIQQNKLIYSSKLGHGKEHSLEVQLPFLQSTIKNLKIVPIVVQDYSLSNCKMIADAIAGVIKDKNVLLLASTDLYHGYDYNTCVNMNTQTLSKIEAFEPEALCEGFNKGEYQACGAGPVVIVQMTAKKLGANKTKVVYRTNSNDVTGQKGGYVVGYGAAVIYQEDIDMKNKKPSSPKRGVDIGLKDEEKKELLKIARTTIEHRVKGEPVPEFQVESKLLKEKRGAFVTINKHGSLRGCIGHIYGFYPLYETIVQMAEAAALRDPRFSPVTPDELDELHIEISVLTPIRTITDVQEIEVGKHGIIIERHGANGLLLPQVATDYGWDRVTFLEHTCRKAGLPNNAWKQEGTIIKIFSADVFGEE